MRTLATLLVMFCFGHTASAGTIYNSPTGGASQALKQSFIKVLVKKDIPIEVTDVVLDLLKLEPTNSAKIVIMDNQIEKRVKSVKHLLSDKVSAERGFSWIDTDTLTYQRLNDIMQYRVVKDYEFPKSVNMQELARKADNSNITPNDDYTAWLVLINYKGMTLLHKYKSVEGKVTSGIEELKIDATGQIVK